MKYIPLLLLFLTALPLFAENLPLPNPGFEEDTVGWTFSPADKGMSQVSAEAAMKGSFGLKVVDQDETEGSSVFSEWLPVEGGKGYRFSCHGRLEEGEGGIGVYMQFFDAARKIIGKGDEFVFVIPRGATDWREVGGRATAPEGAAFLALWIHSFNPSRMVAHFDDFVVEEEPSGTR